MNKPVYSVLSLLNEVLDKPCEYKKNLTNSIDKRKKFLEQKANEKYPKIKALFHFIEYLNSNIENFNQYNGLIKDLEQLDKERNQLKPRNNYKDKQQYDKVQAELEGKFKTLQDNTANLIKAKAKELNVCSFENEPNYSFNGVEAEIRQLKDNFSNEDLPEIFKHKSQYLEYRSQTHGTFLSLQFFFDELDEITKSLFDYFKDTDRNEFEAFEIKAIPVNSIAEAIQGFKKGQTKFTLPTNFLFNTSTSEALPPQQTKKPKPELKLNEFFIKEVSSDKIEAIQTEFRELEGKDLAILIYLLHKEHKIIEILTNSRTQGRKAFVKCLKETDNPTMQKVNKCFTANTDDLIYFKDDLVFQSLNKRLTKIIKI